MNGTALKYGDNINTDIISPPQYMELPVSEAAVYAMQAVDPDFHKKAGPDTIIVAGTNFGSGSSRETSPLMFKHFGIRLIVAKFFARIFYRNAINLGIILLECGEVDSIRDGDVLEVDVEGGIIHNRTSGTRYTCSRIPPHIMQLIRVGGLLPGLYKQMGVPMPE